MCGFLGTGGSLIELGREGREGEHDGNCSCGPLGARLSRALSAGQRVDVLCPGQFLTGGVPRSGWLLSDPHCVPNAFLHYFPKVFGGIKGKGTVSTKPRTRVPVKLTCKGRKEQSVGFGVQTHLLVNHQAPFMAV